MIDSPRCMCGLTVVLRGKYINTIEDEIPDSIPVRKPGNFVHVRTRHKSS